MTIADYRAFGPRVLVVATVTEGVNHWAAYIDAVPGISHKNERQAVAENGIKIHREIAEFLFPDLAQKYTWRY